MFSSLLLFYRGISREGHKLINIILPYPNRLVLKSPDTQISFCLFPMIFKLSGTQIVC